MISGIDGSIILDIHLEASGFRGAYVTGGWGIKVITGLGIQFDKPPAFCMYVK